MDEPQISSKMDVSDADKTNLEEVLGASFDDQNLNKSMEIDSELPAPSTSTVQTEVESNTLEEKQLDDSAEKSPAQDAGMVQEEEEDDDQHQQEPNQTLEQVNFEKLDETSSNANDNTLNYTERSINISEISMDQNADSSDFDVLKQTEEGTAENSETQQFESVDTPKECEDVPKDSEEVDSFDALKGSDDASQSVFDSLKTSSGPETTKQTEQDDAQQMETDQNDDDNRNYDDNDFDNNPSATDDAETETQPSDLLTTELGSGDADGIEKIDSGVEVSERSGEAEDEETETTNQGEGIDENVCLFGDAEDAERELTDADKERVVQPQEITEEEDSELTPGDKDVTDQEPADETMEVDAEQQPEETETEEIAEEQEPEPEPEEVVDQTVPLKENEIREEPSESEETCLNCENTKVCQYRLLEETGEIKFLCTYSCVGEHREDNPEKYTLTQRKVYIYETSPAENICCKCGETKSCKFHYRVTVTSTVTKDPPAPPSPQPVAESAEKTVAATAAASDDAEGGEETPAPSTTPPPPPPPVAPTEEQEPIIETVQSTENKYICDDDCLKDFIGGNTEKYIVKEVQRRSTRNREKPKRYIPQEEQEVPKIVARSEAETEAARLDREESFIRRCTQCYHEINFTGKSVQWETLDFCNEKCLGLYQNLIGAACVQCNEAVTLASIGKLCVRFGFDIKQFCSSKCLEEFKRSIKQCGLCQRNLIGEENVVLAQVGEKRIYRDFCNQQCLRKYESIINPKKKFLPYLCSVCNYKKPAKIEVLIDDNTHRFCSSPCFSAFKFVNNVVADQCDMCSKYFERKSAEAFTIYQMTESKIFCTRVCMNLFICKTREIWQCNWCKVSKYNYDMIQTNFGKTQMCSLNCLSLHEVSLNALTPKRSKCAHCKLLKQPQYHLTMTDASIRSFCTYQCAIGFQGMFSKNKLADDPQAVVPAGTAKRIKPSSVALENAKQQASVPIISRVQSLSARRGRKAYNPITNRSRSPIPVPELTVQLERLSDLPSRVRISSFSGGSSSWTPIPSTSRAATPTRVEHKTQVVTIPPLPKTVSNKTTMCKAITLNKAINAVPTTVDAECQTEDFLEKKIILPLPIPIFIPMPMYMYNLPAPVICPIPLPVPTPVFIPTTRNSSQGIMKEIKKIQDKMPTDPYEAELLMMAEMVAGDRKREETDSDSDENDMEYGDGIENNASFNEDLVQMAFKMASGNDFDDPPVDLENEMTANTISQNAHGYDDMDPHTLQHHQLLLLHQQREAAMQAQRGRKRMQPVKPNNNRNNTPNKRIKREMEVMQPEMPREPAEKPDANMCLKFTFGVNAWKQWVATKNADFEKSSIRRKPIKSEILQLTADELNYSLCMFVKEVRKPNGSEYAPDTIYYLVLGIQQYLYENGRIDNIFTDRYYEQFTDCLDEVAKKFSVLYNDSQYIVTRVEEEHLWECKQLGAHSPHVLLSTLMFFNTKHFNLVTVDEHMELSFSHIMKHWKRNPNQPGAAKIPGSRNVLLRFYPPQSSLEANSRKKKVYEQQENEENPLRCPVKLYEFYLSKCPESVKTRNDVFYLQPERSCVPDSPVWYSTQALSREALSKMLHRVKMVKEINIALLTS